jgi:hypothetical protein
MPIMELKAFYGKEEEIKEWGGIPRMAFPKMVKYKGVGIHTKGLDCRESLYYYVLDCINFNNLLYRLYNDRITINVRINKGQNREHIKTFLSNTNAGNHLEFDSGWLKHKNGKYSSPVVYGLFSFILNYYVKYFDADDPYTISLKMLEDLRLGKRSIYIPDLIFTSFLSYIFSNNEFRNYTSKFFEGRLLGSPNGPGSFFYRAITSTYNAPDNTGKRRAKEWWGNPRVKREIGSILETRVISQPLQKILSMYLED